MYSLRACWCAYCWAAVWKSWRAVGGTSCDCRHLLLVLVFVFVFVLLFVFVFVFVFVLLLVVFVLSGFVLSGGVVVVVVGGVRACWMARSMPRCQYAYTINTHDDDS